MKIPKRVRRDYELYSQTEKKLGRVGKQVKKIPSDPNGKSALEAFKLLDCQGIVAPCREAEELERILWGKASLNWHIQNWAAGFLEGTLFPYEINNDFPWLPDWAWEAMWNQIRRSVHSTKQRQ